MTLAMPEESLLRGDPTTGDCRLDPPADMPISTAVFVAIGELSETPSRELKPFCRSVDPELIDALYEAQTNDAVTVEGEVAVEVAEYTVVIEPDGGVLIEGDG